MAAEVQIVLKVSQQGVEAFEKTAQGLERVKGTSRDAGLDLLNLNAAMGVANTLLGAMKSGLELASQMNELGTATRRTEQAFSAFTGTRADEYIRSMVKATGGLVDDTDLATDAMFLMSRGIAQSSEEIAKITHLGAVLGETFEGSAAKGIEAVNTALEHIGNKRSLYGLNVNVPEVMRDFDRLKATLGDEAAWKQAVENGLGKAMQTVGDNFDKPGAGLEKLNTKLQALKEMAAKPVSIVVDFLAGKVLDSNLMKLIDQAIAKGQQQGQAELSDATSGNWNRYGPYANGKFIGNFGPIVTPGAQGPTPGGKALSGEDNPLAHVAMTPEAIMLADQMGAKAVERHRALVAEAQNYVTTMQGSNANWREAVGLSATVAANTKAAAEHSKSVGIIQGLVGGQGGQLSSDIQTVRTAREAEDRRKGMSKGAIEKDLAVFDRQAQLGLDSYALATGAATKESLAFRDAQKELSKEFTTGKISIGEYSRGMAELAANAASGKTSLLEIEKSQAKMMSVAAANETDKFGRKAGRKSVASLGLAEAAGGGGYGAGEVGSSESTLDPYAPLITSAEKYSQASDQATQHSATFLSAISQHSQLAANSMQPLNNKALEVGRNVQAISKQLYGLSGDLTVHIGFTVSGGGGGKGAASQ